MPTVEFVVTRMRSMTKPERRAYLQELIGPVVLDKDVLHWRALLVTRIREADVPLWDA